MGVIRISTHAQHKKNFCGCAGGQPFLKATAYLATACLPRRQHHHHLPVFHFRHLFDLGFDIHIAPDPLQHFGAQFLDRNAVDRHAPFQNNPLPGTAGSHAGISQKFLQTNAQSAECGTRSAEKQNNARLSIRTPHSEIRVGQASGFVLRRPVILSPALRWPRFSRSAVRSKRFRTLRLPPKVDAARRLRCCDINSFDWFSVKNEVQR